MTNMPRQNSVFHDWRSWRYRVVNSRSVERTLSYLVYRQMRHGVGVVQARISLVWLLKLATKHLSMLNRRICYLALNKLGWYINMEICWRLLVNMTVKTSFRNSIIQDCMKSTSELLESFVR